MGQCPPLHPQRHKGNDGPVIHVQQPASLRPSGTNCYPQFKQLRLLGLGWLVPTPGQNSGSGALKTCICCCQVQGWLCNSRGKRGDTPPAPCVSPLTLLYTKTGRLYPPVFPSLGSSPSLYPLSTFGPTLGLLGWWVGLRLLLPSGLFCRLGPVSN